MDKIISAIRDSIEVKRKILEDKKLIEVIKKVEKRL